MQKIAGTLEHFPFLQDLVDQWKPRAKKIKINLKYVAVEAGIIPQYLTKIITGKIANPRLKTISDVENVLKAEEKKAGL